MVKLVSIRNDQARIDREQYSEFLSTRNIWELVEEFFTYLDYTEETDSGREFHPVVISSCRVCISPGLDMLLKELRKKSVTDNATERE
jgi:hypothetical protein